MPGPVLRLTCLLAEATLVSPLTPGGLLGLPGSLLLAAFSFRELLKCQPISSIVSFCGFPIGIFLLASLQNGMALGSTFPFLSPASRRFDLWDSGGMGMHLTVLGGLYIPLHGSLIR